MHGQIGLASTASDVRQRLLRNLPDSCDRFHGSLVACRACGGQDRAVALESRRQLRHGDAAVQCEFTRESASGWQLARILVPVEIARESLDDVLVNLIDTTATAVRG